MTVDDGVGGPPASGGRCVLENADAYLRMAGAIEPEAPSRSWLTKT